MMKIFVFIFQWCFICAAAPFVSGVISRVKNNLRMRIGAPVLQPYYNIFKLFRKDEVVSETSSWIFRAAPGIVLSSSLCALSLIPAFAAGNPVIFAGDFLAVLFILSLGRFFIALAGLDAGSTFGGMGSSREMFISSLAEPCACLAVFSITLRSGSTNIELLGLCGIPHIAVIFACFSILMVILAETSRLPIDNQETHLELTMIHEAMVLEYSGKQLAFIEIAAHIKQLVWFGILAHLIFPTIVDVSAGAAALFTAVLLYCVKIAGIAVVIAFLEVSVAKMRLFRVMDYFGFSIVLAVLAVISALMGI